MSKPKPCNCNGELHKQLGKDVELTPPTNDKLDEILEELFENGILLASGQGSSKESKDYAKQQILANYTPNSEVERKVRETRIDELNLIKTVPESDEIPEYINKRLTKLKEDIKDE